jgi:O-antigen ligase
MLKYLKSIKNYFFLDTISLCQLLLISFSFPLTYKYILPLLFLTSTIHFFKYKNNILLKEQLSQWYLLLLIYSLIFFRSSHNLLLGLNIIINIYILVTQKKNKKNFNFKLEIIVVGFFIIIFLNQLLFTPFLKSIDAYLFLIFYPLLFGLLKNNELQIDKKKCMEIFVLSVFISSIILFFVNFCDGKLTLKTNTFFAEYLDLSHVYYGIYLGISCLFILLTDTRKSKIIIFFRYFFLIYFMSIIFYIGARMSLIAIIITISLYFFKIINRSFIFKIRVSFLLITTIALISYKTIPRVKNDLSYMKNVFVSVSANNKEDLVLNSWRNIYQRFLVTKYSIKEIRENVLLGIGVHNIKDKLATKIYNDGYKYFEPINSHNQYLDFFLGLGIFGFFYFIFMIRQFFLGIDIYIYFLIFFIIIMLTESVLFRVKGISIFFLFVFIFSLKTNKANA